MTIISLNLAPPVFASFPLKLLHCRLHLPQHQVFHHSLVIGLVQHIVSFIKAPRTLFRTIIVAQVVPVKRVLL